MLGPREVMDEHAHNDGAAPGRTGGRGGARRRGDLSPQQGVGETDGGGADELRV